MTSQELLTRQDWQKIQTTELPQLIFSRTGSEGNVFAVAEFLLRMTDVFGPVFMTLVQAFSLSNAAVLEMRKELADMEVVAGYKAQPDRLMSLFARMSVLR